ncbi:MAG: dTMP kinase, partial [Pseudomonadota bacterium]
MSTTKGLFLTFEGPEGAGKSTQLKILAERLRAAGRDVVETQEPGGTRIGKQIRQILLDHGAIDLKPTAELLLMFASRAQNVDEVILPALAAGKIVLCDRFTDSTLAYQGAGRGLGADVVYDLDRIACRGLIPHRTVLIDIDVATGLARAEQTRMEQQPTSFHRTVRDTFLQLANDDSRRIRLIDGARDKEAVANDVWTA